VSHAETLLDYVALDLRRQPEEAERVGHCGTFLPDPFRKLLL
jgi:hypothetical protein